MTPHEPTSLANEFPRTARAAPMQSFKVLYPRQGRGPASIAASNVRNQAEARLELGGRHGLLATCRSTGVEASVNAAWGTQVRPDKDDRASCAYRYLRCGRRRGAGKSIIAGVATGFGVMVAWTALFFAIEMITAPAMIHADLNGKLNAACKAIRAYNATVDHSMVRNLLLRMREKCLALSRQPGGGCKSSQMGDRPARDLSTLYGPDTAQEIEPGVAISARPEGKSANDGFLHAAFGRQASAVDRQGKPRLPCDEDPRSQRICATAACGTSGRRTAARRYHWRSAIALQFGCGPQQRQHVARASAARLKPDSAIGAARRVPPIRDRPRSQRRCPLATVHRFS